MKSSPAPEVIHWLDQQDSTQLFITTITIGEISYGLNALPQGNRRTELEDAFCNVVSEAFKYRLLPFDEPSAHHYGNIMAKRKKNGQPLSMADGQIVAIAYTHNATIVTHNIRDFSNCDILLINPFNKN